MVDAQTKYCGTSKSNNPSENLYTNLLVNYSEDEESEIDITDPPDGQLTVQSGDIGSVVMPTNVTPPPNATPNQLEAVYKLPKVKIAEKAI